MPPNSAWAAGLPSPAYPFWPTPASVVIVPVLPSILRTL
jgi:hypothetical protein